MTDVTKTYGLLTIDRHNQLRQEEDIELLVLLNGRDVTHHCFVADDRQGYVGLHLLGPTGRPFVGPDHKLMTEIVWGLVRFVVNDPLARPARRMLRVRQEAS